MDTLSNVGVPMVIVGGVIFFVGLFMPLPAKNTVRARYNKIVWAMVGTGEVFIIVGFILLVCAFDLYLSPP